MGKSRSTRSPDTVAATKIVKDVLDPRIKEEVEKVASSVSYAIVRQELHSGPMPSPKQLAEYEQVLPGLAAEIRNEFLANGNHVREIEKESLSAQKKMIALKIEKWLKDWFGVRYSRL